MTWLRSEGGHEAHIDGYRIVVTRRDTSTWTRRLYAGGVLVNTTLHSTLRDAKVWPQP